MITFILCIVDEMFSRESFLAYRPDYNQKFTVLGISFVCVNGKDGKLKFNEPVIAEIASFKSIKADETTLIKGLFVKLSREEIKEVKLHFLTEIKKEEEVLEPA